MAIQPVFQITPNGATARSLADILSDLKNAYLGIYGSDAYLGADSQDGQMLAVFAQALYDMGQSCLATYNSFKPNYAQGAGLSSLVKLNGISRQAATNSTVSLTITGVVGTEIVNGTAQDASGNVWVLPPSVTIPDAGTLTVTATAKNSGNVTAAPNTINVIGTPTLGWQSVNNTAAATPGAAVEPDATLRKRQAQSTASPAQTVLEAIAAAVGNVPGVQRVMPYENATNSTDARGIPARNIALVVSGGDSLAVAEAIASRKPPGTPTYGTTSQVVVDSEGQASTINFYILTLVPITVNVTIKALPGYTASAGLALQQAIAQFINNYSIGEYSYQNRLFSPANLEGDAALEATLLAQADLEALSNTYNVLSITQTRSGNPVDTTVTGGPYAAGSVSMSVASTEDIYVGQTIQLVLDNASTWNVVVTSVAGSAVGFGPAIPGGRNLPNNSNVYLISDLRILFNEAATCAVASVNLTVIP